jgi:3-oxoacyl-[acyl-carrier protein] reductase
MTPVIQDLVGKCAVVTGSSTGIGRAIALALSQRGANLIIHGRSLSAELAETRRLIEQQGSRVREVVADLSDLSQLMPFVAECWRNADMLGQKPQIWVNNAGCDVLTGDAAAWSFSEKLERLWQVDVRAALVLSREVAGRMQQQESQRTATGKGDTGQDSVVTGQCSIVLVGWDQAWQGMAGDSGQMFGTIKGAVMSMTGHLAQSFAPTIRVNCVAPGWIETQWGQQASEYWRERARSESLMDRWGQPEDIAAAVVYLVSPASQFVSGQILNVNGGFKFGARGLASH